MFSAVSLWNFFSKQLLFIHVYSVLFACLQMDDEASLLPRKLQAALEQALEQRNDIISQDSDSESDEGEWQISHRGSHHR